MIPKIIHYCWFGGKDIPDDNQELINEWKKLLPDFQFKLWNEINSPMTIPYIEHAYSLSNWANISNYIRVYALYHEGGIYMDTDFKLIKRVDDLLNNNCFLGIENEGDEFFVNNAFFGSKPKHSFVKELLGVITSRFDGSEKANLSSPVLTTELLREKGLSLNKNQKIEDVSIYTSEYFYPLPFSERLRANDLNNYIKQESYAAHLWDETWLSREDYKLKSIELESRIKELEKSRETFKDIIISKDGAISRLGKVKDSLVQQLTEKDNRIKELEKSKETFEDIIVSKSNAIFDLESVNDSLVQEQNEKDKKIKGLKTKNEILDSILASNDSYISSLEEVKGSLIQQLNEKGNWIKELEKSREVLEGMIRSKDDYISGLEGGKEYLIQQLEDKNNQEKEQKRNKVIMEEIITKTKHENNLIIEELKRIDGLSIMGVIKMKLMKTKRSTTLNSFFNKQ